LDDYLELLDWAGRTIREGKRGAIPAHLSPILDRLGINQSIWTDLATKLDRHFSHVVRRVRQVVDAAKRAGRPRLLRRSLWVMPLFPAEAQRI